MKTDLKIGKFKIVSINVLIPSKNNRKISDAHIKLFYSKLSVFGWLSPIIVDAQMNILDGHHKYEMALKNGYTDVPIYIVTWANNLKEEERLKYILSLNSGSLVWSHYNYLKAWAQINVNYSYAYEKYKICKTNNGNGDIIAPSIITSIYLSGGNYKQGTQKILNKTFSDFLFNYLFKVVSDIGSKKKTPARFLKALVTILLQDRSTILTEIFLDNYKKMVLDGDNTTQNFSYFKPIMKKNYEKLKESHKKQTKKTYI